MTSRSILKDVVSFDDCAFTDVGFDCFLSWSKSFRLRDRPVPSYPLIVDDMKTR